MGSWLQFLTGLAVFVFGLMLLTQGLERAATRQVRRWLEVVARRPWLGAILGIAVTLFTGSSGAVSSLMVGLVSASLLELAPALAVILGAAVGSTITVQLLSFRPTGLAPVLLTLGVAWRYVRRRRGRDEGITGGLIGFGLLLYGLSLLVAAASLLTGDPGVRRVFFLLDRDPVLAGLAGLGATALWQNSATTIALAMSLSVHGLLSRAAGLAAVLGANLGSTAAPLLSSLLHTRAGKRVALLYLLLKLLGVLAIAAAWPWSVAGLAHLDRDPARALADAHTLFNVLLLAAGLPLVVPVARWGERLFPPEPGPESLLEEHYLEVPDLALVQARRAVQTLGEELVGRVLRPLMQLLEHPRERPWVLEQAEREVDAHHRAVHRFLLALSETPLPADLSAEQVRLLYVASDLEQLGDEATRLSRRLERLRSLGFLLAPGEQDAARQVLAWAADALPRALASLRAEDRQAREVIKDHPAVAEKVREIRFSLLARATQEGAGPEITTSLLELSDDLGQLTARVLSLSQAVLGIV